MNRLIVENVCCTISTKQILRSATINSEQGKITGLLGKNGSGKSTLFKVIFGFIKAEECDVFLNDQKFSVAKSSSGVINYLPQQSFLPANIKLNKLIDFFKVDGAVFIELFPEFKARLKLPTGKLSGGEERLLSAVLLLLAPTKFTMLDEPFTHLMPLHVERLKELVKRQKSKKGILLTDHLHQHVTDIADELFFMKEGQSFLVKDLRDLALHHYISDT